MAHLHPHETLSVWLDDDKMPSFSPLTENIETDVCVVGGGIAGLTTAYLLAKEGKQVVVVEDFELASGQTGKTTAHFSSALDDRYFDIEKYHGVEGARLAAESHNAAIQKVEEIVRRESIDCNFEFVNGYLFAAGDDDKDVLDRELEAARRAGVNVHFVNRAPLESFDTGPALCFPKQAELHPVKYLRGITKKLIPMGVKIYTHTRVVNIQGGEPAEVKTKDDFKITCKSVVVATNTPINDIFAIHTKQAPYRSYVVGFEVPKNSIPRGLYWDTLDPYHYVRLEKNPRQKVNESAPDILIVGGEDHKTGQDDHPELRFKKLEEWTREKFPMAGAAVYKWSGQVMEPVDGMAYLGHNPMDRNNVYVITGDSGNGMTHCTIGAMLITDQIMNRKNAWEELYKPSRISLRATSEYLKENANVAAQYSDWLAAKSDEVLVDLQAGEGAVFRDGLKMIAAYKNENGAVKFMSAACPHLAGVVHWNTVEKSWDCPCHGSRFDCQGRVIEGPAFKDLEPVETTAAATTPATVFQGALTPP